MLSWVAEMTNDPNLKAVIELLKSTVLLSQN